MTQPTYSYGGDTGPIDGLFLAAIVASGLWTFVPIILYSRRQPGGWADWRSLPAYLEWRLWVFGGITLMGIASHYLANEHSYPPDNPHAGGAAYTVAWLLMLVVGPGIILGGVWQRLKHRD